MKAFINTLGIACLAMPLLTGCGNLSLGKNVQVNVDPATQTATLAVEMSDGLEISLAGDFPVAGGKGHLILVPATKTENAKIEIQVDLLAIAGDKFGSVTTLPNGAPFPVAITGPLLNIPVMKNAAYELNVDFALVPDLEIAGSIGMTVMSSKYLPAGITACQNFRNQQGAAFAAVCVYGPGTNASGGVFVGADLGNVLKLQNQTLSPSSVVAMSSIPAPKMVFPAISMSSATFSDVLHDPNNKLSGSNGQKAYNNVQKILKAKN